MCDVVSTSDLAACVERLRAEEKGKNPPPDPYVESYLAIQRRAKPKLAFRLPKIRLPFTKNVGRLQGA